MTELRFKIDQNTLKADLDGADIETIERFQEGEQVSSYRLKNMAAKFLVDADGLLSVPYKQAIKTFNEMDVEEYNDALMQFIQALVQAAIPKANGTPLNSPSEAATPAASPDGSSPLKQPLTGDVPPGSSPEST